MIWLRRRSGPLNPHILPSIHQRELRTGWGGTGISQEELAAAIGATANTISPRETAILAEIAEHGEEPLEDDSAA